MDNFDDLPLIFIKIEEFYVVNVAKLKKRKNVRMLVEADLFTYTCAENKCRCRKILISPAQEILKQHHLSLPPT